MNRTAQKLIATQAAEYAARTGDSFASWVDNATAPAVANYVCAKLGCSLAELKGFVAAAYEADDQKAIDYMNRVAKSAYKLAAGGSR